MTDIPFTSGPSIYNTPPRLFYNVPMEQNCRLVTCYKIQFSSLPGIPVTSRTVFPLNSCCTAHMEEMNQNLAPKTV